jgi:hypothetical protein
MLSTSPRKTIPLALGDDWEPGVSSSKPPSITKRIFFCGVVVESEGSGDLSEGVWPLCLRLSRCLASNAPDVRELVCSFGEPTGLDGDEDIPSALDSNPGTNPDSVRPRLLSSTL